MSDFSIDQSGSTGNGIEINKMYSRLGNIWIYDQAGDGYALSAKNCTLSKIDDVHISKSNNGVKLDTCYYPRLWNCSIERSNGVALKMISCADVTFNGLYLDHGGAVGVGQPAPELVQCQNCTTVNFYDLSMELSSTNNLTPNRQMHFLNTSNLNVFGGRINHNGTDSSTYMFYFEDCSAVIQGLEWFEYIDSQILAGAKGAQTSVVLRDIVTYVTASGSKHGLGCWDGEIKRVKIENWTDRVGVLDTYIHAAEHSVSLVDSNITYT